MPRKKKEISVPAPEAPAPEAPARKRRAPVRAAAAPEPAVEELVNVRVMILADVEALIVAKAVEVYGESTPDTNGYVIMDCIRRQLQREDTPASLDDVEIQGAHEAALQSLADDDSEDPEWDAAMSTLGLR